jgi:uncharacterized protein YabN with tetrapyrrole methylase and pyrophosphatase domain
MSDSEHSSPE